MAVIKKGGPALAGRLIRLAHILDASGRSPERDAVNNR